MTLNNPLDTILDNAVKVRILRVFCRTNIELNGRQVAREVKAAPRTAHKVLQQLSEDGVLQMKNVGKTYLFNLNQESILVKDVLKILFNIEKKVTGGIFEIIEREIKGSALKKDIISVALFGSTHEKKSRPGSDVDLLVIVRDASVKEKVEKFFEKVDAGIAPAFGNTIAPYINTIMEFKTKIKGKLPVVKNILSSHRLIYGEPLEGAI